MKEFSLKNVKEMFKVVKEILTDFNTKHPNATKEDIDIILDVFGAKNRYDKLYLTDGGGVTDYAIVKIGDWETFITISKDYKLDIRPNIHTNNVDGTIMATYNVEDETLKIW